MQFFTHCNYFCQNYKFTLLLCCYQHQSMEVQWPGIVSQQAETINSIYKSNDNV